VVAKTPVLVDCRHRFLVAERRLATHLRLDVFPDGGLTRLRCFGEIPDPVRTKLQDRLLASLPETHRLQLAD
jgi:allantoicase